MNTFDAAVNVLRRHNRWRRGDDTVEAVDPALLGCAIDTVCDHIEKQAKVPDDVARDAERYRWLRDYATEHLYGDELISLFDRHSSAFDAGIDAAMLAAKAKGE